MATEAGLNSYRIASQLRGGNRATKAPAPRWPHAPAAGGKLTALTPVQIEILAFMREYLAENDQLPPVAQGGGPSSACTPMGPSGTWPSWAARERWKRTPQAAGALRGEV